MRAASAFANPVQTETARVLTESDNDDSAVVSPTFTGVAAASAAAVSSFSLAAQYPWRALTVAPRRFTLTLISWNLPSLVFRVGV